MLKIGTVVRLKPGDWGGRWFVVGRMGGGMFVLHSERTTGRAFEIWRDPEQCEVVT